MAIDRRGAEMIRMEVDTRVERILMKAKGTAMEEPQRTGVTAAMKAVPIWVPQFLP